MAYIFASYVLRHCYAVLCPRQGWNFTLNVPKEVLGKNLLLAEKWTKINWYIFFPDTDGSVKAVSCSRIAGERQASVISHEDNLEMIPG